MLKFIVLPFQLLKALGSLLLKLVSALHRAAVEFERFAGHLEKASDKFKEDELARLKARERGHAQSREATGHSISALPSGAKPPSSVGGESVVSGASGTQLPRPIAAAQAQGAPQHSAEEALTIGAGDRTSQFPDDLMRSSGESTRGTPHARMQAEDAVPEKAAPASPARKEALASAAHGVATVRLILFDLDGTLLRTADLERFRGRTHTGQQSPEYIDALTDAFHRDSRRWIYREKALLELLAATPDIRYGVFTRAPRKYALQLLDLAYPQIQWDVVVAFEDVRRSKPYGDGVLRAMRMTGVSDMQGVVVVGDDVTDIQAAYSAGCLAFLETGGWTESNRAALEKIPDAKVRGAQSLLHAVRFLSDRLPALESAIANPSTSPHSTRFDPVVHQGLDGKKLVVHVAGRLFTDGSELATRKLFHEATQSILGSKNAIRFPDSWISVLIAFLQAHSASLEQIVVTIIPQKRGRPPRLERLLAQIEHQAPESMRKRCQFISNLLVYSESASSHSGQHLNRRARMLDAQSNLSVKRPEWVRGRDVVVIDDVVTSGATLLAADSHLLASRARSVTCVALAKAVRFS